LTKSLIFADVTLDALAAQFGYSRRQVIRIIQDCTGERFTQLAGASAHGKSGPHAQGRGRFGGRYWVGCRFSDRTGFYRAFKKHFGCTPKAYCQGRRPPLTKGSLF
jgi:AraC-like DNA-binding protein